MERLLLDALNRLTNVAYPGSINVAYTYDNVGNHQTQVVTGGATPGTTTYGYDATDPNVLTSVTPPGGSAISYSVDNQGNTTARGSDSFGWNGENELTSGTVGGTSFAAQYNGDGLRATRTVGSTTTSFVWGNVPASSSNQKIPVVLDDGTQYVYGLGLVEHVTSGSTYYVLADGSGSTVALVDSTGTVQQKYAYDAYGTVTATSGSQPTEYQYDGQQTDPTGLQYLRARYYDPSTGRFLSRDPSPDCVFDPATHQPFIFADNNPGTGIDPSGMCVVRLNYSPIAPLSTPVVTAAHLTVETYDNSSAIICQATPPGGVTGLPFISGNLQAACYIPGAFQNPHFNIADYTTILNTGPYDSCQPINNILFASVYQTNIANIPYDPFPIAGVTANSNSFAYYALSGIVGSNLSSNIYSYFPPQPPTPFNGWSGTPLLIAPGFGPGYI